MAKRKHVRDLAPFASSEDLSDERESPLDDDLQKSKLSNIEEEIMKTPPKPKNLNVANAAPRIDISRASSSSHQEDSSPERELYLGKNHQGPKLEIAFGEEMASDLHSSTEELSFQGNDQAEKTVRKKSSQMDLPPENYLRKDSACSDIALLSISGRTSRVSSVGSVASGGSGASCYSGLSHCSAVSRLSAVSNLSRGSSPHRMSVETSFCGPKPVHTASLDVEETAKSIIDKLQQNTEVTSRDTNEKAASNEKKSETHQSRTHVSSSHKSSSRVAPTGSSKASQEHSKHKRKKPALENPKMQQFISLHSDEEEEPIASRSVKSKTVPVKPSSEPAPILDTSTQIYIPLKGSFDESTSVSSKCEPNLSSPKRLKPFTNSTLVNFIHKYDPDRAFSRTKARAKSATEVDYKGNSEIYQEFRTFISLKDDDDCGDGRRIKHNKSTSAINTMVRSQEKFLLESNTPVSKAKEKKADEPAQITVPIQVHQNRNASESETSESKAPAPAQGLGLPKYLMTNDGTTQYIPLRGSDSELLEGKSKPVASQNNHLSVSKLEVKSRSDDRNLPYLGASTGSNIDDSHLMPSTLELSYRDRSSRSTKSMTQLVNVDHSRTPSPNTSMHKHHNNNNAGGNHQNNYLFRRCSESAKEIHRIGNPKSRSGSFRSLFSTIFKRGGSVKHKKNDKSETPEISTSSVSADYFVKPKTRTSEPESIIIPLHSPDEVPIKKLPDRAVSGAAPQHNINNTNINDKPPTIVTTMVKMEYSEEQIKHECGENGLKLAKKIKPVDDQLDKSTPKERSPVLSEQSPDCHQVQCEVTVHHCERLMSAELKRKEKLVRTEMMVLDSSDGSVQSGDQESSKTDADSEKNSAIENRVEILSVPAKEPAEDDGGDVSTDSDKGTSAVEQNDEEYKKLVSQEESFEELPYVPTTLPLERSVALPIVPIKERVCEIRTCPVDRPRSGAPMNPVLLKTYVNSLPSTTLSTESSSSTEKLHITLPRADPSSDSPRKKVILGHTKQRHHSVSALTSDSNNNSSPPPLPPRKSSMSWIMFDETGHESRQSPRRITTVPSPYGHPNTVDRASEKSPKMILVKPDECSCECHESATPAKS